MKNTATIKRHIISVSLLMGLILPGISLANYVPLALSPTTTVNPLPLLCYDFKNNIKTGARGDAVRRLQFFLLDAGYTISPAEYGQYNEETYGAVKAFQEKYKDEILTPAGLSEGNGFVGKATRAKLNALYGCAALAQEFLGQGSSVNLKVTAVSLDSNSINVSFCNQGNDVPTFPVRLRLNGVIRDFDILGAKKGATCTTESFTYGTWGFTYDPGATYTVVTVLDPLGLYKKGKLTYPINNGSGQVLTVPVIAGAHLAVRSLILSSTGIQATFCNQGINDLNAFPARITTNGMNKDFDIAEVHSKATCKAKPFSWDQLGVTYATGTTYNVTVVVDPNNVIAEVNEFDNAATISGTP